MNDGDRGRMDAQHQLQSFKVPPAPGQQKPKPTEPREPRTTRRGLLAGAAALSAAGALAAGPALAAGQQNSPLDICSKAGPCPCDDPCHWGQQALDDLRRAGWPNSPINSGDRSPEFSVGSEADAELIRLCELFHRQHAAMEAIPGNEWAELGNAAIDARRNTIRLIEGLRAVTERGRQMKASVAVVLLIEYGEGPELALATLRDMVGEG